MTRFVVVFQVVSEDQKPKAFNLSNLLTAFEEYGFEMLNENAFMTNKDVVHTTIAMQNICKDLPWFKNSCYTIDLLRVTEIANLLDAL